MSANLSLTAVLQLLAESAKAINSPAVQGLTLEYLTRMKAHDEHDVPAEKLDAMIAQLTPPPADPAF